MASCSYYRCRWVELTYADGRTKAEMAFRETFEPRGVFYCSVVLLCGPGEASKRDFYTLLPISKKYLPGFGFKFY
jgi:hypothetical protein